MRLIFIGRKAENSGVFRYDLEYGLSEELTTDVSNHYPVYVELWIGNDIM